MNLGISLVGKKFKNLPSNTFAKARSLEILNLDLNFGELLDKTQSHIELMPNLLDPLENLKVLNISGNNGAMLGIPPHFLRHS